MLIAIGSRSEPKVTGVCRAFGRFPELWEEAGSVEYICIPKDHAPNKSKDVTKDPLSGVSKNPMSVSEIVKGAITRAKEAWEFALTTKKTCSFAVGLEAGNIPVAEAATGYFCVSFCAIYDGHQIYLGGSPLFEYPPVLMQAILAGEEAGHVRAFWGESLKPPGGVIGKLTSGRFVRSEYEELAAVMALTQIVSKEIYLKK